MNRKAHQGDDVMDSVAALQVYKELADWYERQGQSAMRDRFLILAAEAAFSAGKSDEAERLRQRLLKGSPHHMLKPFSSFSQALQSTNVQIYVHDLQVNYPPETARDLLQSLHGDAPAPAPPEGGKEERSLPQTAPLIEIRDEPALPLSNPVEPLKVYPLRDEPAAKPPVHPSPRKPTTAAPPARSPMLAPPLGRPQPTTPAASIPARPPRPAMVTIPPPPAPEAAEPRGAWLSLLLAGMTLTAGVALAVYTLARPFLPPQWLP